VSLEGLQAATEVSYMIASFLHQVEGKCPLLGNYAENNDNFLPTDVGKKFPTTRCVITQKSAFPFSGTEVFLFSARDQTDPCLSALQLMPGVFSRTKVARV